MTTNHVYLGRIADIFKCKSTDFKDKDEKASLIYLNMAELLYDIQRSTGIDVLESIPKDKIFLNHFERKEFSEFGQDGIIEKILSLIGDGTKTYHEIGLENFKILKEKHNFTNKTSGDIDFLSIDVQGNDWYTWRNLTDINARCVMIAYNGEFEIEDDKVIKFDTDFVKKDTNYFGATLKATFNLAKIFGYSLVCCNNTGTHAFFIRHDCIPNNLHGVNNYRLLYRSLKTNPNTESGYFPNEDKTWTTSEVLLRNHH